MAKNRQKYIILSFFLKVSILFWFFQRMQNPGWGYQIKFCPGCFSQIKFWKNMWFAKLNIVYIEKHNIKFVLAVFRYFAFLLKLKIKFAKKILFCFGNFVFLALTIVYFVKYGFLGKIQYKILSFLKKLMFL